MRILSTIWILLMPVLLMAQEDRKWILGYVNLPDSTLVMDFAATPPDTTQYNIGINYFISSSNICDDSGNLLFTSNGLQVADAKGGVISGGSNLEGTTNGSFTSDALPQGVLILPCSSNSGRYLLLHEPVDEVYAPTWDVQPLHLYYSVVNTVNSNDLHIEPGKSAKIAISDTLIEGRLTACRHGNGMYWWVLAHEYQSNRFYSILLADDTIKEFSSQYIGNATNTADAYGQASFSVDGSKYAMAGAIVTPQGVGQNALELYDFDRCSGQLSNYKKIVIPFAANQTSPVGCSFSPNGRFLYVSDLNRLFQYDLQLDELILILPSDTASTASFRQHQIGPDGKIYISMYHGAKYFAAINNPDLKSHACNLLLRGYNLNRYSGTIPTFPNFHLGALTGSGCDTLHTMLPNVSDDAKVRIYPTPADRQLLFETTLSKGERGELVICNMQGIKVKGLIIEEGVMKSEIDVSSLPSGLYVYYMNTSYNHFYRGKIVVEH